MRLTNFCNRLPSRAPCGSLDSRSRSRGAAPCGVARSTAPAHPGPGRRRFPSVVTRPAVTSPGGLALRVPDEPPRWASLDGEAPASVRPQPPRDARRRVRSRGPVRSRVRSRAVLAELRSVAPLRGISRRRRCRPRDGPATLPLTSSCLPRRIRHRCRIPIAAGCQVQESRRLVKDADPRRTRTPSIAECSLPRARTTLARVRVGSRGARHRCRCSRAGGFRRRDPASGACSPAELARVSGEPAS